MNIREYCIELLIKFKIDPNILNKYDESHRYYHNFEHIDMMIKSAMDQNMLYNNLTFAIIFHDIIYNVGSKTNEEDSANLFKELYKYDSYLEIYEAILSTKDHVPVSLLSEHLIKLDLERLYGDFETFVEDDIKIFKEFQYVDYDEYLKNRISFLEAYGVKQEHINYIKYKKPNIAIYAGSFNPFHKGHLNILEKAEKIFDKVIIARGINPNKNNEKFELPKIISNREIIEYNGLLSDLISNFKYNPTLIRGLRNASDLEFEQTQSKFLKELNPNINIVSIFCDVEYQHISSSAIRTLKLYNKESDYLL